VTNYSRVGAGILSRSIDIIKLQAATGQTIRPIRVVQAQSPVAPGTMGALRELKIYKPAVSFLRAPSLQTTRPLQLDPDKRAFDLPRSPVDSNTLPPLGRPSVGDISPPSLGGVTSPSLGNPVGGALGGVRGRLGR